MTSFVFGAIIDSIRPSVLQNKANGIQIYELRVTQLYSIVIYAALAQSAVIAIFAPVLINIMYGAAYKAAICPLRIVVWYTTFSYLGAARNIWILAEGKQKLLWRVNMTGAAANVVLNAALIPIMALGAILNQSKQKKNYIQK